MAVVLATAGYDHKIRFWEASREKCTRVLRFLDSQVNALCITNDKQYIAAAGNPHAKIFQVNHGEDNPLCSYDAHTGNVTCLGFQCDAKWMYRVRVRAQQLFNVTPLCSPPPQVSSALTFLISSISWQTETCEWH